MRKLVGATLFAVIACCALTAAQAMAYEGSEWFVGGAAVTSAVSTETDGALLLTDLKASILGASSVECNVDFHGTVNTEGKGEVTEIQVGTGKSTGNGLTGKALECKGVKGCEGTGDVYPIGLPWKTQLEIVSETEAQVKYTSGSGVVGYEVECSIFGIKEEDECTQAASHSRVENMSTETPADVLAIVHEEGVASCSLSKESSGDASAEELVVTVGGSSIAVDLCTKVINGDYESEPKCLKKDTSGSGKLVWEIDYP